MKTFHSVSLFLMLTLGISICSAQQEEPQLSPLQELGDLLGPYTPNISSNPTARPDIIVHPSSYNQLNLSIATSPTVPERLLLGSYTAGYGVGYYYSINGGNTWDGNDFLPQAGAGAQYPKVAFAANGDAYFLWKESNIPTYFWIKKSTDGGSTWLSRVGIATGYPPNYETLPHYPHLAADATPASPFANRVYMAYTEFYPYYFQSGVAPIKMKRSVEGTWYTPVNISGNHTGTFSRGVQLATDKYGNLFAIWAIYDEDTPSPEDALGFNHSTDGGVTWANPRRAVEISGIWGRWTHKNPDPTRPIEVNSFPSLAIDKSGGPYRGRIYATWADNRNGDPDIYFARLNEDVTTDQGASWTGLKRVNNDQLGNGKDQWMPSITVSDQGIINIVFYDSRNDPNNQLTETWLAQSTNGGNSFTNYRISDVAFTPYPAISEAYFGDYNIGVTTSQGYTVPCWVDNRSNHYQAYVERFVAPPVPPQNVQVAATPPDEYGYRDARVTWQANPEPDLAGYELWRRITGVCGNGVWYLRATLNASATEFIDSLSTVGYGNDCTAEYKLRAKNSVNEFSDYSATVSIGFSSLFFKASPDHARSVPTMYALHGAYPNPFNPSTQINFDLPENGFVTLDVFDVLGRRIENLMNGYREADYYRVVWDASQHASGVYIVRLSATGESGRQPFIKTIKLVLTK